MLLRLLPDSPTAAPFDIVNNSNVTGYTVTNDTLDFGNAAWQHALSGARGTQGALAIAGEPDNRVVTLPIRIGPSGSVDAFNLKAAYLVEAVDELRRFGGRILWQATTQTPRQYLRVVGGCGITRDSWTRKGRIADVGSVTIVAQCAPYMLGDPMDTLDPFASNTIADYTFDIANAGAGALAIANGLLVPGATGLKRVRHTAKGYVLGDVQVTVKVTTGATVAAGIWGVTKALADGTDTLLSAEIVGTTNVLRIAKYVAGVKTDLGTVAFTPVGSTTYWVRLQIEGNLATAYVYAVPPVPAAGATWVAAAPAVLSTSDASRFAFGHAGLRISEVDATARYDDFTVSPFTYRAVPGPVMQRLAGGIPGDVPALVDATVSPSTGTATPVFGLVSWLERPAIANLIWNGDFEDATIGVGGWSTAAVTGVLGAGTSMARITTAGRIKYGLAAGNIVTPATTDTGATFPIHRPFRQGRTYAFLAWLSSTAGVTSTRVKLGANGDLATGAASALTTTPRLYSVVWTPTGFQVFTAYAAIGVNAATLTNIAVDAACVVESPTIALSAAIGSAGATTCTVYAIPGDVPNLNHDGTLGTPFLAMIEQEIVRVTAIDPATKTLTIDRGFEGTTAATHAIDLPVVCLPPLRAHIEGKGAFPAWGSFSADSYVAAVSGTGLTIATVASALDGSVLRWTPGTSGPQASSAVYFVDPHTLVPDDYTQGEIDVEVWVREAITVTLTGLLVTLSAQAEGGSTMGPERTTREFANRGKPITPSTDGSYRWHRLGVLPMIVDRTNPQRWRLKVAMSCTGGAAPTWDLDHLTLVASRSRLASPTGEPWDVNSAAGAYPPFVPYDAAWGGTSMMSRTIRSDGSCLIGPPGGVAYPADGMGDVLEVPDGEVDVMVKTSQAVPDDPVASTIADIGALPYDLHFAVTPRYVLSRAA